MSEVAEQTAEQVVELVKIDANEYGLQATEAAQVEAVFVPMITQMRELENEFNRITAAATEAITPALTKEAKEIRMKYVKIRTGTATIHKKAKAYYLAGGRFVDGWKNAQAFASQGKEATLLEIEQHFERIEAKRLEDLANERWAQVKDYTEIRMPELPYMTTEVFTHYLEGVKATHAAKVKAEQEAEKERIRIEEENKRYQERERCLFELGAGSTNGTFMLKNKENADFSNILTSDQIKAANETQWKAYLEEFKATKEANETYTRNLETENKKLREQAAQAKMEADEAKTKAVQSVQATFMGEEIKPDAGCGFTGKEALQRWIDSLQMPELPQGLTIQERAVAADIEAKTQGFKRWATAQINTL